jgi:hypothetical protein
LISKLISQRDLSQFIGSRDQKEHFGTHFARCVQLAERMAKSKEQAQKEVDKHVSPSACFVELENTKNGWRAIPGTGMYSSSTIWFALILQVAHIG